MEGRHSQNTDAGEEFAQNLREVLWQDLKAMVLPEKDERTGVTGIGLEAFVDILKDEAKKCSQKHSRAQKPDYQEVWLDLSNALKEWINIVRECRKLWFNDNSKPECLRDK